MTFKKHEPNELDIRMTRMRELLNQYLDARAVGLSDMEEFQAFEHFYCEAAKVFEAAIDAIPAAVREEGK